MESTSCDGSESHVQDGVGVQPQGQPQSAALRRKASRAPGVRAAAVSISGARITYPLSRTPVLDGLNMSVAEGSIYGLLGASGCGKTTLLTCIVGRRRLDEGSIHVLGLVPGARGSGIPGPTLGYMPQELALHASFTVAETFRYFGWVAGMSREEVERRGAELLKLLDIPFANKLVGALSGGQQRRVSLGVALLHRPPVLILDEPTVGVDPTLRQSIWDMLLNETRSGRTTVIITTHYIEEARQSDKVGLMRNGTLLDEDSPERLLRRYDCDTMEDVFLKLSVRQQRHLQASQSEADGTVSIPMVEPKTPEDFPGRELVVAEDPDVDTVIVNNPALLKTKPIVLPGHSNIIPCVWKMLIFTGRNKPMIISILGVLPILVCVLFRLAVGGEPNGLHLAVVNEDYSCADGLPAFPRNCDVDDTEGLSCRYLRRLSTSMFVQDEYGNVEAALQAVRKGLAWGALHFPANYSRSMSARYREGKDTDDFDIDNSQVAVWLDMSNRQVSEMARNELAKSSLTYFSDVQRGCKGNPRVTSLPMQINEAVYGTLEFNFADFFAPALILSVVYNINCIYTMSGFLDDKRDGFMERSVVSGVHVLEILAAHVVVDTLAMLFVTCSTLVFMCGFLRYENNGPLWALVLLNIFNGYSGMFQGYFIASLFSTDFEATFCAMGFYFPTLLLSGLMWPLEGMHPTLRNSVWLLPLNLATTAIRSIMSRGWSVGHAEVRDGFLSSVFWFAFFALITVATLRLKKSML